PRPVILRLTVHPDAGELCIRVWDPDPTAPPSGQLLPGDDEERGRGLFIVKALSSRWGWHPGPNGGKFVWSALSLDVQPPAD
ncbi:MAG TPA: ATP-binding protein, partial [Trebonia sp.]|nr:ATP-binding protein [Trebonia sp.]